MEPEQARVEAAGVDAAHDGRVSAVCVCRFYRSENGSHIFAIHTPAVQNVKPLLPPGVVLVHTWIEVIRYVPNRPPAVETVAAWALETVFCWDFPLLKKFGEYAKNSGGGRDASYLVVTGEWVRDDGAPQGLYHFSDYHGVAGYQEVLKSARGVGVPAAVEKGIHAYDNLKPNEVLCLVYIDREVPGARSCAIMRMMF
jgi:hypothetical protein